MKIKDCEKIIRILEICKTKYEDKLWNTDITRMILRLKNEIEELGGG